jgi:RNA polymerase sigma-70 factor (ECF subfamily)
MDTILEKYWEQIREGDERAFEIVFKKVYPALHVYASHILHDKFIADEIVLDVFSKIWENRQSIYIRTSFKAYLIRCVRNQAIDTLKKSKGKKTSFQSPVTEEMWKFIIDTVESDDSLVDLMIASETEEEIGRLISALTPQCRLVFEKSRLEDKSVEIIAAELNISKSTVRSHIYHALTRLADYFHAEVKKS